MSKRAVSQRTSIPWALPPWFNETPPFARRSASSCLATTKRFLFRASPCPRAICGVPYGRPEKAALLWTTTFRPNSATRYDARARPYGLLLLSRAGFATPCRSRHRLRDVAWRAMPICVTVSMNPHKSIIPARCLTGLRRSLSALGENPETTQKTVAEPQAIPNEDHRSSLKMSGSTR